MISAKTDGHGVKPNSNLRIRNLLLPDFWQTFQERTEIFSTFYSKKYLFVLTKAILSRCPGKVNEIKSLVGAVRFSSNLFSKTKKGFGTESLG